MTGIIRKFFRFCPKEHRKQFYQSIILGIFMALFRALKIPAIAILLYGVIEKNVTGGEILASFLLVLTGTLMEGLLRGKATALQTRAGYGTATEKRIEIAEHLRYVPMGNLGSRPLGEITSVVTNVMDNLQSVATRVVLLVLEGVLTTALIAALVLIFDWRIGLILILGCLVYFLVNTGLQKRSERISPVKVKADTALVDEVLDYVQGMQEVKAYGLVGERTKKLNRAIDKNVKANTDMEMVLVPYMALQSMVTKATGAVMSLASIGFFLQGSMDLLTCIIMIISAFMVYGSLEGAGNYSGLLRIVDVSCDKAEEILSIPRMDAGGEDIKPDAFDLKMQGVSFSYETRPVISDVTEVFGEKKTTALAGPSGSGKTTLAFLLARFWDADKGRVLLGGRDVREYSLDALMENFSFVFQNVWLFHDTIKANIRFGDPGASMEKVYEAAKKAQCHDFIMALPDQYDTVIGENGDNLSGGERQRISIARALMKDSPIIILDEATANVDPENEQLLVRAIEELTKEKTVIMIAHRLKTVRAADRICVLEKGQIVQEGTHEELSCEDGVYRSFLDARQFAEGWTL